MRARAPITRPQAKPVRRALRLGLAPPISRSRWLPALTVHARAALTHAATAPARYDVGPQVWYDATWSSMLQHGVVCCNMVGLALDRLWFRLGRLRCLRFALRCNWEYHGCRLVLDPIQYSGILRRLLGLFRIASARIFPCGRGMPCAANTASHSGIRSAVACAARQPHPLGLPPQRRRLAALNRNSCSTILSTPPRARACVRHPRGPQRAEVSDCNGGVRCRAFKALVAATTS
jgi:hypothetical protein